MGVTRFLHWRREQEECRLLEKLQLSLLTALAPKMGIAFSTCTDVLLKIGDSEKVEASSFLQERMPLAVVQNHLLDKNAACPDNSLVASSANLNS